MEITKTVDGTSIAIAIDGRLDTTTAPQLDAELKASLDGMTRLDFDLGGLE